MKKALHAKPFRLQMPGHTPRHARPEPARSKLLRGVSLCLAAVCLAAMRQLSSRPRQPPAWPACRTS